MGIPPTGRPPSTPPSKGKGDGPEKTGKEKKEFRMPDKKGGGGEKDEEAKKISEKDEKKKSLFDLAGEPPLKELKPDVLASSAKEIGKTSALEAKTQIDQISKIIMNMVERMMVGKVGGKDMASLNLKQSPEVPRAFAGSNLTISFSENGLVIRFDNFMTPQMQQNALALIEQNKQQLMQMVNALQAKNIQVAQLNIGEHTVALPRAEPLPPPFQPTPMSQGEQPQRDRGDEGEGRQGQQEENPE